MADPDLQPTPRRSPRLQQLLENRSCGVITKEDAMKAGEPPKLYKFKQPGTRGPTSLPAIWFKSMARIGMAATRSRIAAMRSSAQQCSGAVVRQSSSASVFVTIAPDDVPQQQQPAGAEPAGAEPWRVAARRRCARELRALRSTGDRRSAIAARRCALDERAAHERSCLCRAGAPTHGGAWRRQPPLAAAAAGTRRRRWRRLRRDDGGGSRRRQLRAGAVACGVRRAASGKRAGGEQEQ